MERNYIECIETSEEKDYSGRKKIIGRVFHLFPKSDGTGRAFQRYESSIAKYLIKNFSLTDKSLSFTKQRIRKFQSPLKGKVFYHAELNPFTDLFEGFWKGKTDTRAIREGRFVASIDLESRANLGKILLNIESENLMENLFRLRGIYPYSSHKTGFERL